LVKVHISQSEYLHAGTWHVSNPGARGPLRLQDALPERKAFRGCVDTGQNGPCFPGDPLGKQAQIGLHGNTGLNGKRHQDGRIGHPHRLGGLSYDHTGLDGSLIDKDDQLLVALQAKALADNLPGTRVKGRLSGHQMAPMRSANCGKCVVLAL
jgi:hypothetical protein